MLVLGCNHPPKKDFKIKYQEEYFLKYDSIKTIDNIDIYLIDNQSFKTGRYRKYNLSNSLLIAGNFLENKKHGLWNYYNTDSVSIVDSVVLYLNGSRIKKFSINQWYENKITDNLVEQKKITFGDFENNKKHGYWYEYKNREWFGWSGEVLVGEYLYGEKNGIWYWIFEDKMLDNVGNELIEHHLYKIYELNYSEGRLISFKDRNRTITLKPIDTLDVFFPKNFKLMEIPFVNGKQDGTTKVYFTKLMNKYFNVLLCEIDYKEGELNGLYKVFYFEGNLRLQGRYLNGEKVGEWLEYSSDGKIMESGYYSW